MSFSTLCYGLPTFFFFFLSLERGGKKALTYSEAHQFTFLLYSSHHTLLQALRAYLHYIEDDLNVTCLTCLGSLKFADMKLTIAL